MDDQEFLNQALQDAQGDETAQKATLLEYQQAIFETLQALQPCENDGSSADFVLLRKRAERFLGSVQRYQTSVAVLPLANVTTLIRESATLFGDVARLCTSCQKSVQQNILARFRELHTR